MVKMENITLTEFIDSVIEQNLDEKTSAWQTPTRKKLIFILKGLEKIGIVTKNKLKSDIEKDVYELINNSQVSALTKKTLFELFNLYSDNYGRLREESIQEQIDQNNDLIQNTYNEWQGTRGKYTPTLEQQAMLDEFNAEHEKHLKAVSESFQHVEEIDRDKVMDFFNDPKKMFTKIDAHGDVCIVFPQCGDQGVKIKSPINFANFTEYEKKIHGSQDYLYKKTLYSGLFKQIIDHEEQAGYSWNADKEDEVMHYMAQEFGLSYNSYILEEQGYNYSQSSIILRIALWKKSGWDFINRDKYGKNGDKYGKINGQYVKYIQKMHLNTLHQSIDLNYDDTDIGSFTLVGIND